MKRILVVGAGPAGMRAALRAAELGANVELVTSGEFGGMAANDGLERYPNGLNRLGDSRIR